MSSGWAVRVHTKPRKRFYHPIHGNLPFEADLLSKERMTVRHLVSGGLRLHYDDWRETTRTGDEDQWRGYTFLKLKMPTTSGDGATAAAADDASSNGSYEVIRS